MSIMNTAPVGGRMSALLKGIGISLCVALLGGAASKAQTDMAVTYPAGGERCVAGSAEKIEWATTEEGSVQILLWNGETGDWSTIASNVSGSQGYYWWTPPEDLRGEMFRVKVESMSEGGAYALSPTYFYVVESEPLGAEKGMLAEGPASSSVSLGVLPNPATAGVARVSYAGEEPLTMTLRDLLGNAVMELAPSAGSAMIPTTSLPNGIYIVEAAYRSGMRRTVKLVVGR